MRVASCRIARHDHPAFARGDRLVGVEAEDRGVGTERADEPAFARRGKRMRSVFHHFQAVTPSDAEDGRHVGGQTAVVHGNDRLRLRRHGALDLVRIDAERRRVDVDQLHVGTEIANHLGGGGESVRGRDHLVARADAERFEREMQASGGRVDGQRLQRRVAEEGGEVVFEALGLRAGGEPARAQGVDHLGDLFFADLGQRKGQERQGVGHRVRPACRAGKARASRGGALHGV